MALKWLFHFKIFDHVLEEPIEYDELAESANVPVLELKRMLRIVMASFTFSELEDGTVQQTTFSRAFAHDENMRRGIPFFLRRRHASCSKNGGCNNSLAQLGESR